MVGAEGVEPATINHLRNAVTYWARIVYPALSEPLCPSDFR